MRLGRAMLFAEAVTKTYTVSGVLEGWPPWLVILCATVVAAVVLWVLSKILKFALGVLIIVVVIGGIAWAGWALAR
jgi:hypothetical protein